MLAEHGERGQGSAAHCKQAAPGDYVLVAGLSGLPGTAASAALKPVFEWVPSQNGLVVEPPQRH
jgi:hypothetical protein